MNVSKSQAKRLAIQTEPIDVNLRVQELAMANGHIEYLRGKLQELQTEVERLTRFEVQHLIRFGQETFIPNEQLGDSNE